MQSPFRYFHSFVLGLFGALGTFALLHAPDWAKGTQFQVYAVPVLVPVLMLLFRSSRFISEFLLERMALRTGLFLLVWRRECSVYRMDRFPLVQLESLLELMALQTGLFLLVW